MLALEEKGCQVRLFKDLFLVIYHSHPFCNIFLGHLVQPMNLA